MKNERMNVMKNVWKKAGSVLLAVALILALGACGETPVENQEPVEMQEPVIVNDPELVAFVEEYGDGFAEGFASSFSQSAGMGGNCELSVQGTELTCTCCLAGLNNIEESVKTELQKVYDGMHDSLKTAFSPLKEQVSTLTAIRFLICEEDGDVMAEIYLEME